MQGCPDLFLDGHHAAGRAEAAGGCFCLPPDCISPGHISCSLIHLGNGQSHTHGQPSSDVVGLQRISQLVVTSDLGYMVPGLQQGLKGIMMPGWEATATLAHKCQAPC